MSLPVWSWDTPDPVVADSTLIRASHLNDIRNAINDTRQNIPSSSDLISHQAAHARGGVDPIAGPLLLSDYSYYGMSKFFGSADPVNSEAYLSNNIRKSSVTTWTKEHSSIGSTLIAFTPTSVKFGYAGTGDTVPSYPALIDMTTGDLSIAGGITASGNSSITGNLTVNGTVTATNITDATVPDPLSINRLIVGATGSQSTAGISVTAGDITLSSGSYIGNYCDIGLGRLNGILMTPGSAINNQIFQIYGINNTTYRLCIMPEITTGANARDFELLLTDNTSTFTTPVGNLAINSLNLKLQNMLSTQKLLIGLAPTGVYANVDIDNDVLIYNRTNSYGLLKLNPVSTDSAAIKYDSAYALQLFGSALTGCTYTTDKVIDLHDKVIIGDGYGSSYWRTNGSLSGSFSDSGSRLWIPYGASVYSGSVSSEGYIALGAMNTNNVVFDNRGMQSRTGSTSYGNPTPSPMHINPHGGDVVVNGAQDNTEMTGSRFMCYGPLMSTNNADDGHAYICGARTGSFAGGVQVEVLKYKMTYNGARVLNRVHLMRSDGKYVSCEWVMSRVGNTISNLDTTNPINYYAGWDVSPPVNNDTDIQVTYVVGGPNNEWVTIRAISGGPNPLNHTFTAAIELFGNTYESVTWMI